MQRKHLRDCLGWCVCGFSSGSGVRSVFRVCRVGLGEMGRVGRIGGAVPEGIASRKRAGRGVRAGHVHSRVPVQGVEGV